MTVLTNLSRRSLLSALSAGALASVLPAGMAGAVSSVTGFRQGVAEAAARDEALAAFYRMRDFAGIWSGGEDAEIQRRNVFLAALTEAPGHAMPASRHDPRALIAMLQNASTPYEQGQAEVEMSRQFLRFALDMKSGMLVPQEVDRHIKLELASHDRLDLMSGFARAMPVAYLRDLPPRAPEYARLVREKLRLDQMIAAGGWGPEVPGTRYEPGESGAGVVALRNRLVNMEYLVPTATRTYDASIQAAVERFQLDHGLESDGVAGEGTLAEINVSMEDRQRSVIVAMERERWTNAPRGDRHVWVNICDFTANIVDHDQITFKCRSVVGATSEDRQTPEFTDLMEFMVINPSWSVPRSIVVNEYLPQLQRNPGAAGHLRIIDSSGRVVDRGAVNFGAYNARNFPFAMNQAPSRSNALGIVKFMFPNVHNIYLHDTPAKDLFAREVRAFSHGCIRLADPVGFAHHLLERQTDDPDGLFSEKLETGAETRVSLEEPIPVHLDYRTAFTDVAGGLQFRRDIYGRDARIWSALADEGVAVSAV
jgi:murein L,D-transpeptidase YcbB/YkuD